MKTSYDIIVVGGGLNGTLAALVMADAGFTVAVIDGDAPSAKTLPDFDGRTTALAYASVRLIDRLGLWKALEKDAAPINDILVTDGIARDRFRKGRRASGFLHFDSRELGEGDEATPLGWIAENRHLLARFYAAIKDHPSIDLVAPARCRSVNAKGGLAVIELEGRDALTASLVLAADGRPSPLREAARIKKIHWGYSQTAIVCTVAHERDHKGVAQEFFLPSGPFAILPLTDNRSSIVWTEKKSSAGAYMALPEEAFMAELENRFGPYLGELRLDGPRWSHPLGFHVATRFYADRLALIGDAAHGVHPIAGQGLNLGIKDIAALRDVLVEARQTGLDIGHGTQLARYDRWRRYDTVSMALGMDALNRLMSNDIAPIQLARSFGMGLVNRIDPLRRHFMRQAGADAGKMPTLMQG